MYDGKGYKIDGGEELDFKIKNGKGHIKEYHENGKIKFEGDYLNGLKQGKGKLYDAEGYLRYEGKYDKGQKIPLLYLIKKNAQYVILSKRKLLKKNNHIKI